MGALLSTSEVLPSSAAPASSTGSSEGVKAVPAGGFAHLDASRAVQVDREVFPGQIEKMAGGPPALSSGERIVRFLSAYAAELALPGGKHGVVESPQPMAVETSPGHRVPVDLGLAKGPAGVFESARPLVGVVIPARAKEGVQLLEAGVSLTPVDAKGASLGGAEGAIEGASVVYANTQTDADTAVRPTLSGVEASTVLRTADSPSTVYFRVGLPVGARLVQSQEGSGPVQVMEGSHLIALVRPPGAVDVAGEKVPTSMSVSGDLLAVSVATHSGAYEWPIAVDPELAKAEDFSLGPVECHRPGEAERESSNWCFHPGSAGFVAEWLPGPEVLLRNNLNEKAGEYAVAAYHTQGDSKIYKAEVITSGTAYGEARLELAGPRPENEEVGHVEVLKRIALNEWWTKILTKICGNTECSSAGGSENGVVAFKIEATGSGGFLEGHLQAATVYVAQEKGPEASLNTTEEHLQNDRGRVNIAFTKDWLSPTSGSFEYIVHDPGIGVSEAGAQEMGAGNFHLQEKIYETGKCNGVQCKETFHDAVAYSPEMGDGEHEFELWGRDKAGLFGYIENKETIIKVDGSKPYNLGFTGMREEGAEVSAAPHTLTVHATDGTEPVPSSGVKSVAVSVDGGGETTVAGASCAKGPCTASGTYTLAGEALSEGVHRLVVTATDNAGNVAAREFTFDVRHGTPMPVGPGTVDPTTGQFKLSATDVSLAGSGGVSRVFQSRDLNAGTGGPLGSQWALGLGGGEGITVLPDESAVLTSPAGGTTTFWHNQKTGELESPLGDENIKLEAKEKTSGKGISEYLLKDAKAGTTTIFTQPLGTEKIIPIFANQFGQEGAKLGNSVGIATDTSGNVWVTDYTNDRILEFSSAGVLLKAYGSEGAGPREFHSPWGIAINRSTGNVYLSDSGNNRIVELNSSGEFVRAFGWGVAPGGTRKNEFQDCTAYCEAGIEGSGAGQLDWPQGVAVDSSGNVWVAEERNNRLQEFDAEGKYLKSYGSAGSGAGQFNSPANIAFYGSDLYVADQENNRIDEFSNTGAFVGTIGWGVSNGEAKLQVCTSSCRAGIAGSGDGQFHTPVGVAVDATGDIYVGDYNNDRVQELTATGTFLTKFGSAGSGNGQLSEPYGVAIGPSGGVYVAEYANKRIQEWTRPSWLPARTEGALKNISSAYAYEPVEVEGKVVIEPTEALAATPAGITCVGEHGEVEPKYLKEGCRALTFNYAATTTAKGEGTSEWGDYKGNLTRVYMHAYDPSSKTMQTIAVAHYLYDTKDRLRAVWDPRIEPEAEKCVKEPLAHGCLVTTYGYDASGRVTAVTPPHQETWSLVYGTVTRDGNLGRLLKVTRSAAFTKVWSGETVAMVNPPILSGTPVVGVRMATSEGQWSIAPLSYGYQWEDCNAGGAECAPIAGATNQNYTPKSGDAGHTLVAQVTATNGSGSVTASSKASAVVLSSWQEHSASRTQLVDGTSAINAVSCVPNSTECVIADSKGNAFYATNVSSTGTASWKAWSGPGTSPSEAVACPTSSLCLMAVGGNLYYATSLGGSWSLAYSSGYGVEAVSCVSASFCADGQGAGFFRWSTSPASSFWNLQSQGLAAMKGIFCLSASFCAIADSKGSVHVAISETQVKSSSWTETNVDGTTALNGISCTSVTSCVAVDSTGNVLNLTITNGVASVSKRDIDATNSLNAVACTGGSTCVTVDAQGNTFVSTDAGSTWKKQFAPGGNLTSVSCASSSLCVTASTAGSVTSFDPTLTQPLDETSSLNAVSCIPNSTECVVSDGKGNAYYATNVNAGGAASWKAWTGPGIGPSEALACPSTSLCLLAAGEDSGYGGNLYYATSVGGTWTQAYSPAYGVDAISCPSASFCADGQDGGGYFRWATTPASTSWNLQDQGSAAMKGIFCLSVSFCAIADSTGSVHVATNETQVKSSSWTQTSVDGSTALNGIACTSTSSCVAVDGAGNVLNLTIATNGTATASKQDIDGTTSLTAVTCTGASTCVTVDAAGNVFVSTDAGKTWSKEYQLGKDLTSVSCATSSLCATVDTAGRVTALNPTSGTKGTSYTQSLDAGSSLNAVSCVPSTTDCVISDGNGNAFYATNVSTTGTPTWKIWSGPGEGPSQAVSCPTTSLCMLAAGSKSGGGGNLYDAQSLGGPWSTVLTPTYGALAISCPSSSFCAAGDKTAWDSWSTSPTLSWSSAHQTLYVVGNDMKAISCLSSSFCATVSSEGYLYVATSAAQIATESWTRTDIDGSSAVNGIACTSTSLCLAADSIGNVLSLSIAANGTATVLSHDIDGTNSLNAIACSGLTCATVDGKGKVFTSTDDGETWSGQYTPGGNLTGVSCASASLGVTVNKEGETTAFNAAGLASDAAQRSPRPGTPIEYGVPVSGEGAPQNLSKEEVEKWGQKDLPTEATAVFPPDEPQGWPASGYQHAMIAYFDEQGRTVNAVTPGGAIATTEYNEANETTRTLTPDNRVTAMAEGCVSVSKKECRSAETAEKLDNRTEYNEEDSQITRVLGPEHKVKLSNGTEVQARAVTHDYYNKGAQEAEEKNKEEGYNLLTESTSGALLANGEEKDTRTTVMSYNGQNDLGWKLRKPTSTTTDPHGLNLTAGTVYDPNTGEVLETQTPGANSEASSALNSLFAFGGSGTGVGQLEKPSGVARDSSGNVWVVDTGHNRVQEFNAKGEFVREFGAVGKEPGEFSYPHGIAVSSAENVYVADTNNSRVQEFNAKGEFVRAFGSKGTGEGQFENVWGVATDGEGHVWTLEPGSKSESAPRVQEFSSEGIYIGQFGKEGTGQVQFKAPKGIAVDSSDNIWIADSGNNRVQEIKPNGEFIRAFGAEGTGNGQFKNPYGIAIDAEGDVWVADAGNDRVQRLTAEGSYLSQSGRAGNENDQFNEPEGITVDSSGNAWIADTANNRVQELTGSEFVQKFGGSGSGAGQLESPTDVATDSSGNAWVVDTGHNRVQEFNAKGEFVREFGVLGKEPGEFSYPHGVAVSSTGNVYVADTNNSRVQEFNTKGEFIRSFGSGGTGSGQFADLWDVAVDGEGHVWTLDKGEQGEAAPRVQEFTAEGLYVTKFGAEGTGNVQFKKPRAIVVDPKGNVWVADSGNNRVQAIKPNGEFIRAFGVEGTSNGKFKSPSGLALDAEGDIWVADSNNDRLQRFTSEGGYISQVGTAGNENGQFSNPGGLTIDSAGNLWIADSGNNRVQELTGAEFVRKFGGSGTGAGQLAQPGGIATDPSGNIWVADTNHDRVQEFNTKGEFVREFGAEGKEPGEFSYPHGIAVSAAGNVYVADTYNSRVQEFNTKGEFVRAFGSKGSGSGQFEYLWGIAIDAEGHVWTLDKGAKAEAAPRVQEFTTEGVYITKFGSEGTGNGQFKEPTGITVDTKGNLWIADTHNNRIQEIKPNGEFIRAFGSEGTSDVQFKSPTGIAVDPEGYIWITDSSNDRVQRLTTEGNYLSQFGMAGNENGQFAKPEGIAISSAGTVFVADAANNRIQAWTPEHKFAHDTQTTYYTPGTEARIATCQNHPEWANLPCRTEPTAQPLDATKGQPALPVVTMTYNIWDEVETTTETFGSVTRTKTQTYDPAGRAITSEETSTLDTALPKVTNEYNPETGALEKQSATIKGEVKTITAIQNALGQLVEYKDATGNIAKYTYEQDGDGRLLEVSEGKGEEAKSNQTYTYDPTTGLMTKLVDSGAGTFTASYDLEGKMTSEIYPNGMCANTTYDSTGTATCISYIKTRNCSENNPTVWFSDSTIPSIHGEVLSQTSTLASESYAYDNAGRLLEAQETPAGKGCTARIYAYDEESNRTSLTTRTSSEGACPTAGGTTQQHSYDEANRIIDASVEYDALGNTTRLPAADAGGHEIKSTYYVDNQVATQEQNKILDSYTYDPAGRTMETSAENTETKTKTNTLSHYAGTDGAVTWIGEEGHWSRNVP
ncbi:MAG: virginiamycin B lyase family protein, partial [Solirubrobacteraceae bacterium]